MDERKLISIVVPVFNEEANLQRLYDAVKAMQAPLRERYRWEIVFTDNHSTDRSFAILQRLAEHDQEVRVIRFSRNFGYQKSIWTGYLNTSGHAVIQLDCDLQDPPQLIPRLLELWEQGNQVVYGVRDKRQESGLMTGARRLFYRLISALSEHELPLDAGDFRLVDRCVIEELAKIDDASPYLRGTIATLGFNQVGLHYERSARQAGESKFRMKDLVSLALDGILNHSVVPLRLATYASLAILVVTVLLLLGYFTVWAISGQNWPAGFTTLLLLVLSSTMMNALFFGILGEYIGRIYRQVKRAPMTVVEKDLNPRTKASALQLVPHSSGELSKTA